MSLRVVDVSSWQEGIDLASLDCDGAVVKATQGTGYVNPDCVRAVEQALAAGKPAGVYHYISGSRSPEAEADFFVDQITGWLGRVVLVLDWEENENSAWGNEDWLRRMAQRVIDRTGTRPIIYASAAVFPWGLCASMDLGAWVAQYADMEPRGWEADPWRSFSGGVMHQYTSNGRLAGWSGGLDLNLFYGDRDAWDAYAGGNGFTAAPAPAALAEDGWAGPATVTRLQEVLGTPVDGVISGQAYANRPHLVSVVEGAWKFDDGDGSEAVRELQRRLEVEIDGHMGPVTITALQRRLGVTEDGYLGPETVRALQRTLNGWSL